MFNVARNNSMSMTCRIGFLLALVTVLFGGFALRSGMYHTVRFDSPIDAISIATPRKISGEMFVSGLANGEWTEWYELETEDEQDPLLMESNLIIFPSAVSKVRFVGWQEGSIAHPLHVSQEPVSYQVAATRLLPSSRPKILRRSQWGADESLLISSKAEHQVEDTSLLAESPVLSGRQKECDELNKKYPNEFKISETIRQDPQGRFYRWEKTYSPQVRLLVVHHTADRVDEDERTPLERMRLLYQFHAKSRGWGDIGYHFVIDEEGQIYEGRDGGKYVVGGHAYCSNIGSIGVALMGNFNEQEPSQNQAKSLQWLLTKLASDYDINLSSDVVFHGKSMSPVVGHKDLVATSCPGESMAGAMDQIRRNIRTGNINASVRFPQVSSASSSRRVAQKLPWYARVKQSGLSPVGSSDLTGRPGSQARIAMTFTAGDMRSNRGERIAEVVRSNPRIGIWQIINGKDVRVRKELILPQTVRKGEELTLQLRLQLPRQEGIHTVKFDDIAYVLNATGRATGTRSASPSASSSAADRRRRLSSLLPSRRISSTNSAANTIRSDGTDTIRIRLSYPDQTATVAVPRDSTVNGATSRFFRIDLKAQGDKCMASEYGKELASGVVRIEPAGDGISTIQTWEKSANRFRGIIECQIVDGELALINELPLETYMAGLAEEPDSEPYQKQRAFAIAARSYAAHYLSPSHRKFPGKPYDGNDSPASFQMYGGVAFELKNPRWVQAVNSTKNLVIKKDGQVVKTPYFSTDDGATKSPRDAGWPRFPFAEVFESKPDPWCKGMIPRGHGVGMSGCGAHGQALEGKTAEEILHYYYSGVSIEPF